MSAGSAPLETVATVAELRRRVAAWRGEGHSVGLVPTMGALHDGHVSLVAAADASVDRIVATIFVNPTQFGPNEDYAAYPRDEAADLARLAAGGADLVFMPGVDEMYPDGFATTVAVARLTEGLCGAHRPGHFEGVATIVAKLLNQARADRAFFGEKDYQQLRVIARMARDLDIATEIVGVPTVREPDGLAMSSRNRYLDAGERRAAPTLYRILLEVARDVGAGQDIARTTAEAREVLSDAGFRQVDYVEVRDAETLAPLDRVDGPARAFGAAWLGRARLIDNVPVP